MAGRDRGEIIAVAETIRGVLAVHARHGARRSTGWRHGFFIAGFAASQCLVSSAALAASASGLGRRVDVVGVVGAARLDGASTSGTTSGAESRESWRLVYCSALAFFASQKKVAS